jgi:hypothetical protein
MLRSTTPPPVEADIQTRDLLRRTSEHAFAWPAFADHRVLRVGAC